MISKYVCFYVFLSCHHTREITSFQSVSFGDIVFGDSRVHGLITCRHKLIKVSKTRVLDLTQNRNPTHSLSKPWLAENGHVQRLCAVRRAARSSGRARNVCCRPAYPISIRVRGGAAIITAQVSFDWILGDFNLELARIEDRQRHSCKLA